MENQNPKMNKIKNLIAKYSKTMLGFLGIAVIGCGTSTSCKVMYGAPYADYEIKGRVVNEQNEPIKGVVVTASPSVFEDKKVGISDISGNSFDAVTAEDGTFYMSGRGGGFPDSLFAVDVDSMANGGYYHTTGAKLEMTQTIVPGKDDNMWYRGAFSSKDILFKMKEKVEETTGEGI